MADPRSGRDLPKRKHAPIARLAARATWMPGVFLAACLLLGGAGSGYPLIEMALELAAIGLLAGLFTGAVRPSEQSAASRMAVGLTLAVAALPLVQLVPLPPSIWARLPGHVLATDASAAAGLAMHWRPLSLTPDATRRAALSLLPPIAMLVAVLRANHAARVGLLRVALGAGFASCALGAWQFATGGGLTPFESAHQGFPVGLFVNRNHQATLLLACIVLAGTPGVMTRDLRGRGIIERVVATALIALFALGVVATSSRMGCALLPVALAFGVGLAWRGMSWRGIMPATAAAAVAAIGMARSSIVQRTLTRAAPWEDERREFWINLRPALREAWPWGTGLGSFGPIYRAGEPLESVGPHFANHAHSDYMELVLEAGLPGAMLLALAFVLGAWAAWRRCRGTRGTRTMGVAAAGASLVMLLHEAVDYPLRMTALAVLFAAMAGLLLPPTRARTVRPRAMVRQSVVALLAIAAGWQSVTAGWSDHLLRAGDAVGAARATPWMAAPQAEVAAQRLAAGDRATARASARTALAIEPLQPVAWRVLALADGPSTDPRLVATVARLGWRDVPAQAWLLDRALRADDARVVIERADALLRQGAFVVPLLRLMSALSDEPAYARAIAVRLEARPRWCRAYRERLRLDARLLSKAVGKACFS